MALRKAAACQKPAQGAEPADFLPKGRNERLPMGTISGPPVVPFLTLFWLGGFP